MLNCEVSVWRRNFSAMVNGWLLVTTIGCGTRSPSVAAPVHPPAAELNSAEKDDVEPREQLQFTSEADALSAADQLMSRGEVKAAEELLQGFLRDRPEQRGLRRYLASILVYDGRPDDAVATLAAAPEPDVDLLVQTGDIRFRQARQGRNIVRRRGVETASPSRDALADAEFERRNLAAARDAYDAAAKLKPDETSPREGLAHTLEAMRDFDAALNAWRALAEQEPGDRYQAAIARCLTAAGDEEGAVDAWRRSLEVNPRSEEAHAALAKSLRKAGRVADAELHERQARFYGRLPRVTTIEFSAESEAKLATLQEDASIAAFLKDESPAGTDWLAAFCRSHPHNLWEEKAFAELERRGEAAIPALKNLFDEGGSTCTIRQAALILARAKTPGLFERLERMLPQDVRAFFDMNIAGALGELGDSRAIGPLVNLLDPKNRAPEQEEPMTCRIAARVRAALALALFDDPTAEKALREGYANPRLTASCGTALFRKTGDARYLEPLRKQLQSDRLQSDAFFVFSYLRSRDDSPEAAALVKRWEEHSEAEDRKLEREGRLIRSRD